MKLFELIKWYLRRNSFYTKHCQTSVNDARYFCRGIKYYYREYSLKLDKKVSGNTVYFIIDPNIHHPGLADRFKAIIGSYYIAKINGFNFKIIFKNPFLLEHYLVPNISTNWIADFSDLSYSFQNSRIIAYNGGGKVPKLNKHIKQYHIYSYIGYDILETNKIPNYQEIWGTLFRELFKPSPILQEALSQITLTENEYISVHIRFVNALENFEENEFKVLSDEEKNNLISRCDSAIRNLISTSSGHRVVVFSDSQTYLNHVKETIPEAVVLSGNIKHISFNNNADAALKTFVDFSLISKSKIVYRFLSDEIYATVFSYYAALSNGKECKDILI